MSMIDDALAANPALAKGYDPARSAPPHPQVAIVTCADPRLTGILQLLGFEDADVDLIRNVGTVVDDDVIRSLVVSTQVLGSREILIINHTGCGMTTFADDDLEARLRTQTGKAPIAPAKFYAFTDVDANTKEQVFKTRSHPWISAEVPVRGFVLDLETGLLREV
ncbi:MAG: carbonic anhydrase [Pseudolysinimonas sp.]